MPKMSQNHPLYMYSTVSVNKSLVIWITRPRTHKLPVSQILVPSSCPTILTSPNPTILTSYVLTRTYTFALTIHDVRDSCPTILTIPNPTILTRLFRGIK